MSLEEETDIEGRRPCDKIGGDRSVGADTPGMARAVRTPQKLRSKEGLPTGFRESPAHTLPLDF